MTNPEWLALAARRSTEHTWTLGYVFEQYMTREGKTREQLAEALGCSLDVLDWLAVCRCPAEEQFMVQLAQLKERFAVDTHRLAAVIRRVQMRAAFSANKGGEVAGEGPVLLAARDHTEDDGDLVDDDDEADT